MNKNIKKHAYLIQAHNNRSQLIRLIHSLDYELNDIYLHIDAKSPLVHSLHEFKCNRSNIYFVKSVNVHWGGFSQIQAEMNLIEDAYKNGPYSRYHLISGNDIPLKNQNEMHDFFDKNIDVEYIHFDKKQDTDDFEKRMGQYHMLIDHIDRKYPILYGLDIMISRLQKILGINRLKNFELEIRKGANWFSITQNCVELIIKNRDWIYKNFRYTKCCDEVFLQTLVYNSSLFRNVYFTQNEIKYGNLRLTDWKRGKPYIFKNEDYDMIINSGYLFARKFDEKVDSTIIDRLHKRIEID